MIVAGASLCQVPDTMVSCVRLTGQQNYWHGEYEASAVWSDSLEMRLCCVSYSCSLAALDKLAFCACYKRCRLYPLIARPLATNMLLQLLARNLNIEGWRRSCRDSSQYRRGRPRIGSHQTFSFPEAACHRERRNQIKSLVSLEKKLQSIVHENESIGTTEALRPPCAAACICRCH